MFAWQVKPSPLTLPANGMQPAPVCTAVSPRASTTATWRTSLSSSAASSMRSASRAPMSCSASSSFGPPPGTGMDCVATAPTPARSHGTTEPTENQCDCTATPSSSVSGSRATMEYVPGRRTERIMTPRAERVRDRVRAVPAGFVSCYSDLDPAAPRFAGSVLASSGDPDLPWWRIVRADGSHPAHLLGGEIDLALPRLGDRRDVGLAGRHLQPRPAPEGERGRHRALALPA